MLELSNYNLYNQYGSINPDTPFQPFGAIPMVGSILGIDCSSWLNKPINNINVKIDWDKNIPGSFAHYYKGYNTLPGYTNSSFKVNVYICYQNNRHRVTPKPINLFEIKNGVIQQTSTFNIPVDNNLFKTNNQGTPENKFGDLGNVIIKLTGPAEGFGCQLYPSLLSAIALKPGLNQNDFPSVPYIPIAVKLKVSTNYTTNLLP